jgi:phosphatidylglycerophosphatase A
VRAAASLLAWPALAGRGGAVAAGAAGQLVALLPLSAGLWHAGVPGHVFPWPGWASAFLLFRLLAALPPFRDRAAGGALAAGAAAGATTALLGALAHGWLA